MPYQNVPDNLQSKMERCVGDVTKKGTPKQAAIAICYNSVVKGKELNYRLVVTPTTKAITDAPELRGEDARNCWNCQYFKSLPQTHLAEEVTDISADIHAPSDVVEASSGRGVCEQFEFETDVEWVCDAWAKIEPVDLAMKQNSLAVFKQADGNYRWVAISSNAFQDREKEIVTLKALADDCERADAQFKEHGDAAKAYGTLRWWHVGKWDVANQIAGQGLDLGVCDFNAMHGKMLVESGTFHNPAIGAAIKEIADDLELSIGFFHPLDQPDASGAYTQIRRFERSLLPRGRGSNPLTAFSVAYEKGEPMANLKDKLDAFLNLFGNTPQAKELAEGVMQLAEQKEIAAESAGVKSKEEPALSDAQGEPPAEDKPSWFVADMKPEEFQALIARGVADALAPMLKELGAATAATLKENGGSLEKQFAQVVAVQGEIDARLKEIEGVQTRAFRASQDQGTVTSNPTLKERAPGNDNKAQNDFLSWVAQSIQGPPQ